jgi:membrane protein DedA with SNARE-associated domain
MLVFVTLLLLQFKLSSLVAAIPTLVRNYGYLAIFVLMLLESASLPVPSEVVLPVAGLLAAKGLLSFPLAFVAGLIGAVIGSLIDYALGYYIGKELIYKHLSFFHIKRSSLDQFDIWFEKNGIAAVFLTRMIPVVRTVINFPAGFAKMRLTEFLGYSLAGMILWDLILMTYGYYLLSASSAVVVLGSVGLFAIVIYFVYRVAIGRHKK